MTTVATIRQLCDVPGSQLNDAFEAYAKGGSNVPRGIKASPILYGELTRHYLQWSAGLLSTMEQAAAARVSHQANVARLLGCASAYFAGSARWPSVAHLQHPLRLLMPAYYTVRAIQRVNALARPHLVGVELEEAHEFAIEVLGHAVSNEICAHKNADLKDLAPIQEEPSDVEPLHHRSFLHVSQRARLKEARTPPPPPPIVVQPPLRPAPSTPPPAPLPDGPARVLSWTQDLSNRRIVLERTNDFDSGYGSGSSYYSKELVLDLLRGLRYRLVETTVSRASYGSIRIGGGPSRRQSTGRWEVRSNGLREYLVLHGDDGRDTSYVLAKAGRGEVRLDGRARSILSLY